MKTDKKDFFIKLSVFIGVYLWWDFPLACKFQNARTDVEGEWICLRTFLFDQVHCIVRGMSLCNEDACAHRHTTVDSASTMGEDLSSIVDRFQCDLCSTLQGFDGNRHQRRVKGWEPEQPNGSRMRVLSRAIFHAHIDDQHYAESAQGVVIFRGGGCAYEKVICNDGKVHARNGITKVERISFLCIRQEINVV